MTQKVESGTPVNLTNSGAVSATTGNILGFYVNNTTAGVINFKDGGSGGTAITGSITPAIGFHRLPAYFTTSCYMTLVSGAIDITVFFSAG
jgi:hypothetical protein